MKDDSNQDTVAFWFTMILFVVVLLFALLSSCAEWTATHKAGVRRVAESRLKFCRQGKAWAPFCYTESRNFCADAGLEDTCGEGYQP